MRFDKQECLEWAFGNLLDNATRGKVAEFIVAKALGVASGHRQEWDSADLRLNGLAIEVKSAGYLQSWHQTKSSRIEFDVGPRKYSWDPKTNEMPRLPEPRRLADIYVFCVFAERRADAANPLDTEQWDFFVASTRTLNESLGSQRTARLSTIRTVSTAVSFEGIHRAVMNYAKDQKARPNA